jgi:TonB family protein
MFLHLRTRLEAFGTRLVRWGGRRVGWSAAIALHAIGLAATTIVMASSGDDSAGFGAGSAGARDEIVFTLDLRATSARAQPEILPETPPADRWLRAAEMPASDEIVSFAPDVESDPYAEEPLTLDAPSESTREPTARETPFARDASALANVHLANVHLAPAPRSSRGTSSELASGPAAPGTQAAGKAGSSADGAGGSAGPPSNGAGGSTNSTPRTQVVAIATPRPEYPQASVRRHEEGRVLCRIHVLADGTVDSVDVVTSSGFDRLDRAAIATLSTWRFHPATCAGIAVATHVEQLVTFKLDA